MEQQPEPLEPEAALTNRIIDIAKPKTVETKKNTKRVVVNTKVWNFTPDELNPLYQPSIVRELYDYTHTHANNATPDGAGYNALDAKKNKFIHQQINNKIRGYKTQDLKKNIYTEPEFIKYNDVIRKLYECEDRCFYCKYPMLVLYENVRDPSQWTVERMDNKLGHVRGNFEMACLSCNIRRKTIHFERYILTKRLKNITKTSGPDET
jgi:hypothetical protein